MNSPCHGSALKTEHQRKYSIPNFQSCTVCTVCGARCVCKCILRFLEMQKDCIFRTWFGANEQLNRSVRVVRCVYLGKLRYTHFTTRKNKLERKNQCEPCTHTLTAVKVKASTICCIRLRIRDSRMCERCKTIVIYKRKIASRPPLQASEWDRARDRGTDTNNVST